jgi:hypothetical protein
MKTQDSIPVPYQERKAVMMTSNKLLPEETYFTDLPPWLAWILIAGVVGLIVYGVQVFDLSAYHTSLGKEGYDLDCYRRIVERIHDGEGYYPAAHVELIRHGSPTQSVFNWRLPFLAWAMGHLPYPTITRIIALFLSFIPLWIWFEIDRDEMSFPMRVTGCLMLLGTPIYSFIDELYFAHEFWCGILIPLSIFSYAKGWRWVALSSGIAALMIRELALPFVMVMLVLSCIERKYKETGFWVAGVLAFCAVMVLHSFQIDAVAGHAQTASVHPWITFRGWKFVLGTASMHPYLFLLSPWITAIFVPAALLGLLGWKGVLGRRLAWTVAGYIVLFLFIGQWFNLYWGAIYVDLLPIGILFTGRSMRDLLQSAGVRR